MIFGTLPIPNLYELPEWLLSELRYVVGEWNKHQSRSLSTR